MRELDADRAPSGFDEGRSPLKDIDMVVIPNSQILRADASVGCDRGGLGEDQGGAADGATPEVNQVPVVRESVLAVVLAQRRHDDSIGERQTAQGERLEKMGHTSILSNIVQPGKIARPR